MRHLLLRRREAEVEVLEPGPDGEVRSTTRLAADALPAFVASQEPSRPRWTWDDTGRWYPALLQAGVRVERCCDLRLQHDVLRGSPFAADGTLSAGDGDAWDRLDPATTTDAGLFGTDEATDGLDVLGEHRRQLAALAASPRRPGLELLLAAESSGALVAAEMTHAGLPWRADVHDGLLRELLGPRPQTGRRPARLEQLLDQVQEALRSPDLNPDSQASLLQALRGAGLPVTDTRSWTLQQLDHPAVAPLLEYKRLARLLSTNGWQWLATWVHEGRFRPEYVVGGVVTGRWSSRGGGALTVPHPLRPAVVADDGWRLVVADAAQLEPRVLAGMARDRALAGAARATDLYQGMVADGAAATRSDAKLGLLGAMYGATRGDSGRMVERLARRYPASFGHVEAAARAGERAEVVHTLLGRGSRSPGGAWTEQAAEDGTHDRSADRERRAWGRFTRNFVVQGTAAEWALAWLALLRNALWRLPGDGPLTRRPHLVLFLHDEVLVHSPAHLTDEVQDAVRRSAAEAGRLLFGDFPVDFPLDVSVVRSWADAR